MSGEVLSSSLPWSQILQLLLDPGATPGAAIKQRNDSEVNRVAEKLRGWKGVYMWKKSQKELQ